MEKFVKYSSTIIPIDRSNIDTDAIIPKQFLKSVEKSGFGGNLFDTWRYLDQGEPGQDCVGRPLNDDFVLNHDSYHDGRILMSRENFGCGSSREHAVWALRDFGIRTVLATSFADIFFNNCFKNGVLPVVLPGADIDRLFASDQDEGPVEMEVDLARQSLTTGDGRVYRFEIDEFKKNCLLEGLDDIALTLQHAGDIDDYEQRRARQVPWLFRDLD
ncbi:MAG TPA: 3-isopropylmalate dehydratase small subunit [Arenicellales bacterium]|jgi:3-isopropylmalate/(R)-2-methylmalate dehydratase small subunit|nr:3-isopropylmalate dehydratase small subunit [Arenicellales bacterium]|tara:strand:- start:214 stop:861 length:648 start_codon:yes stop_codon:yes gene_type:complete